MTMERSSRSGWIVTIGVLAFIATTSSTGCGASWEQSRVPFYMYGSPLVSGSSDSAERPGQSDRGNESTRYALDESGKAKRVDEERTSDPNEAAETRRAPTDSSNREAEATDTADSLKKVQHAKPVSKEPKGNADLKYVTQSLKANRVSVSDTAKTSFAGLYKYCREEGEVFQTKEPAPGDIVFFHNTHDVNNDGRNNDWYTHGAVVTKVDGASVRLIGYRGGAVRTYVMNTSAAETHTNDAGEVVNTQLRPVRESDPPFTRYLSGQLFAGYCSLLGDRQDALIMENWQPGMDVKPPSR